MRRFQAKLLPDDRAASPVPLVMKQQKLSLALGPAAFGQLLAEAPTLADRAHLQLAQQPGAGARLQVRPAGVLGLKVEAGLYRTMLQRRLRMQVHVREDFCPWCIGVEDAFGDHALSCMCAGDRTKRHHVLRNALGSPARLMSPVLVGILEDSASPCHRLREE